MRNCFHNRQRNQTEGKCDILNFMTHFVFSQYFPGSKTEKENVADEKCTNYVLDRHRLNEQL